MADSPFDPAALIDAAVAQTGLDDFGSDSFREGLEAYCAALPEARLNDLGNAAVPGMIVNALSNRLRVTDWVTRNPQVAEERIEAPYMVVGIFRAGTTLLSHLLEGDARHRPLLSWEAGASTPPPTPESIDSDPRIDATRAGQEMLHAINPRIPIVHKEEADGATECIAVLNQDFKSLLWEAMTNVPSYGEWLGTTSHRSAYEYHRSVLQVLQSGGVRGRWSLKSPHHVLRLDEVVATYPDARIIVMHRDPVVVAGSVCSLISTLSSTFSDADHTTYIAAHWTDVLEQSYAALNTFRDCRPDVQIVDVQYAELAADPVDTMAGIYAAFGDELPGQALAAMDEHLAARPKGHFGAHTYSVTDFGLDPGEVAERFAPYTQRYAIRPEAS